ncbi:cysteine proteinase [Mycena amicta]|nr:cysteine proteinase [Mycena amicta]
MSVLDYLLMKTTTPAVVPPPAQAGPAAFEQPPDKIGLLVTEELDKALNEAKTKVARIAKECRMKNRKFRDIEFDLENDKDRCLHGLSHNTTFSPSDVQRVTEIFDNPQFFIDGASSSDIVQGGIGDCWFVSALATMATCPGLVEKFCVARDEQVGVYAFVFFRDMRWVSVVIDDLLYTKIPKYEELTATEKDIFHKDKDRYNAAARKGTKVLYFARSSTEGETWVPLIEKAYAKLHGDYAALRGGEACEAIEDLTGAVSSFIPCKDILDRDEFWTTELLKANQDRLFGCAYNPLDLSRNNEWGARISGLVGNHSYSVLRAREVRGKRFVVVRNPWGESEWTGAWSDGSKEWTKEWLDVLPELGHSFGDDGQFVMEYKDFLASWSDIDRTILFDSSWVMSSQWLEVTTREFPAAWSFGDVSFSISMPKRSKALIVLSQLDSRFFSDISGRSTWSLDFVLYKQGQTEALAEANHARYFSRSVNLEVELEEGEYVVHVRIDREKLREKDYFETQSPNWDERKLARVLTERAISRSIASNFKSESEVANLPIAPNVLAGQTLAELEAKAAALKPVSSVPAVAGESAPSTGAPAGSTTTTTKTVTTVVETTTTGAPSVAAAAALTPASTSTVAIVPISTPSPPTGTNTANDGKTALPAQPLGRTDDPPPLLLPLPDPALAPKVLGLKDPSERGSIFLGLRVYTKREAPATLGGQLRHEMGTSFAGLALVSTSEATGVAS